MFTVDISEHPRLPDAYVAATYSPWPPANDSETPTRPPKCLCQDARDG
jgi:hypothetical protein